ncbi:MAG TPA: potassium transporter TrkA, partial [Clostridiales bacterium]|nr:potassium transporter TrkA [Clostridiales bacterium]
MKSFLVIGMGEFGLLLAQKLTALNQDVMIIDENAER